jgi:Trypsin-like peptidase domain
MLIKSAGEIIGNEITDAVAALKGCVTPIFDVNDKHEAELLGSAVLIEAAGDVYLCTAKHVIDKNVESSLYIDGPAQFEMLVGKFLSSEEHDVAVLKLTAAQTETLKKYTPLQADDVADHVQTSTSIYVGFIGYPETKNRKIFQRNKIKGRIQLNGCKPIEITSAKVRISFSRKRNIDAKSRKRVTAPDPHGMSGGAMFGATVNRATIEGKPRPKLIGISTDYPNPGEVCGANIMIAMAIIRDGWNGVVPARLNPSHIKSRVTVTQ